MRTAPMLALALAAFLPSPAARAEFLLRAPPQTGIPTEAPPVAAAPVPRTGPRPYRPRGFGDDVPLRVAAAQIVPPGTRVEYAPDVSPDAAVTWRGVGQAWWVALGKAVEPHRYRVERPAPGVARIVPR